MTQRIKENYSVHLLADNLPAVTRWELENDVVQVKSPFLPNQKLHKFNLTFYKSVLLNLNFHTNHLLERLYYPLIFKLSTNMVTNWALSMTTRCISIIIWLLIWNTIDLIRMIIWDHHIELLVLMFCLTQLTKWSQVI